MKFGVCYYPEQWPEARWPEDGRLMVAAGLEMVRLAEFAWAKLEPAEGQFDWNWLDRAIAVLSQAGLKIILGTPTAAPPAWVSHTYPQILHVDRNGRPRNHSTRRHYCPNNPRYRQLSLNIVSQLAQQYASHPQLIGWQIDNEFGGGKTAHCYCPNCLVAFQNWLQNKYGTLEILNEAWGTVFWSQHYNAWQQIPLPDDRVDKANPSHELDYFRFASDSMVAYQQLQIDCLRANGIGEQFVTHNLMGLFRDLNQFDLAAGLDFVTWDNYPTGNPDRWRPQLYPPGITEPAVYAADVGEPIITGMAHSLMAGLKQRPFWVMEQQCGHINWGEVNPGIRPGNIRLWTWHALAMGAEAVIFFRWRASLFAQEQYHSGLLDHNGRPAVGYADMLKMNTGRITIGPHTLPEREGMAQIATQPLKNEVAILTDYDDLWAIQLQPHRHDFDYWRLTFVYYQALQRLGLGCDLVSEQADWSAYKLLIVPTAHLMNQARLERFRVYCAAGGQLLLGVRSGFKTASNLVTDLPLPGLLADLVGATVVDWQSLPAGASRQLYSPIPGLAGPAGYWLETLQPHSAQVLADYGDAAAFTRQPWVAGNTYYLAFYPTPDQARALLLYLADQIGLFPIDNVPAGLLAIRRGPYLLLFNFTDTPIPSPLPDHPLTIPPRDLAVIFSPRPNRDK